MSQGRLIATAVLFVSTVLTWSPAGAADPSPGPPGGPATRPAYDGPLTPKLAETLSRASRQQYRYVWGEPVVDDFAKPIDPLPWQVQEQAKLEQAKGRLSILPLNKQARFGGVFRPLPKELHEAAGAQIDCWLVVPEVEVNSRLVLFLHESKPQRMAWDYAYYFAYGLQGRQQMLAQWRRTGSYVQSQFTGEPLEAGKVVHISMTVFDAKMTLKRGDDKPMPITLPQRVTLGPEACVGLAAYRCQAQVLKVAYRPLLATDAPDQAEVWKATPFAGRAQFEAWLTQRVVPLLADRSYSVREDTSRWLARLGPLVEPAIRRAIGTEAHPEARLRLQQLLEGPRDLAVPAPEELPPPPAE